MDNVIHNCKASADYEGGFTAAQYEWLKQDLSFVPKDKMVILCVHIPFRGGWGTNSAHADADQILRRGAGSAVAVRICGDHVGPHPLEHQLHPPKERQGDLRACHGHHVRRMVAFDRLHRGYAIGFGLYRIDGNLMEEWAYRSVRHDEQFQIRLYRASDTFVGGAKYRFKQTAPTRSSPTSGTGPSWTVNVYRKTTY